MTFSKFERHVFNNINNAEENSINVPNNNHLLVKYPWSWVGAAFCPSPPNAYVRSHTSIKRKLEAFQCFIQFLYQSLSRWEEYM